MLHLSRRYLSRAGDIPQRSLSLRRVARKLHHRLQLGIGSLDIDSLFPLWHAVQDDKQCMQRSKHHILELEGPLRDRVRAIYDDVESA